MKRILQKIIRLLNRFLLPKLINKFKINYENQGKINFIDVGSVGGLPEPWFSNANHIKFLLNFESNELPKRKENTLTYNTALWEQDETRKFYISGGGIIKSVLLYLN
jgi:hypothetical protein